MHNECKLEGKESFKRGPLHNPAAKRSLKQIEDAKKAAKKRNGLYM